ncbi:MAG TPA: hypothetical protein VL974_05660 [Magnetospirillum sp.]|jgi:hypothetical protein|nr:hypothetical protein [Magnetospirillum sp.]
MLRPTLAATLCLAFAATAAAQSSQQPLNLLPSQPAQRETLPPVPPSDKPLLDEPSPTFQPMRPAEPEAAQPAVIQPPSVPAAPVTIPAPAPQPVPPQSVPSTQAPAQMAAPPVTEPPPAPAPRAEVLPPWSLAVLVLAGAFLAALFGILTALGMRRAEQRRRRRAVAQTLATELETRHLAYESVPLPPNVDAGVSFVSSVTSLAGIDCGFRSMQGSLHLLPEKMAAHVSVHYAAVQRVSDFVKGQSLAAAVRMLQANRLGGHPCPDAGAMRDAHEELGAAFRGVDKLVQMLRGA